MILYTSSCLSVVMTTCRPMPSTRFLYGEKSHVVSKQNKPQKKKKRKKRDHDVPADRFNSSFSHSAHSQTLHCLLAQYFNISLKFFIYFLQA